MPLSAQQIDMQVPPLEGLISPKLRTLLAPRVYTLPFVRCIGKTMVQGKNYGPQITVRRISQEGMYSLKEVYKFRLPNVLLVIGITLTNNENNKRQRMNPCGTLYFVGSLLSIISNVLRVSDISLINNRNKKGPMMDPWGSLYFVVISIHC